MATSKRKRQGRVPRTAPSRTSRKPRREVPRWVLWAGVAAPLVLAAVLLAVLWPRAGDSASSGAAAAGLPEAPDYHSLLVDPKNPEHVYLGTHIGLFETSNGGRTWTDAIALEGQDAMNLARTSRRELWTAGHLVFAKSEDGGATWTNVAPSGLPTLDIHGFAVDPRNPRALYAAVAGQGLYRSGDGGRSFSLVSTQVGPAVMALAITKDGRILAGDMQQGLMASRDQGRAWSPTLREGLMGLAVNPKQPARVLASGRAIFLSTNGGKTWRPVLEFGEMGGPVAWSQSDPNVGYAVGDGQLYRSDDDGRSWQAVA